MRAASTDKSILDINSNIGAAKRRARQARQSKELKGANTRQLNDSAPFYPFCNEINLAIMDDRIIGVGESGK